MLLALLVQQQTFALPLPLATWTCLLMWQPDGKCILIFNFKLELVKAR